MAVAAGLLAIFAPQTTAIIAPGFQGAQRDLYIQLFRLMCVTPVIFAASIVLGEVLVAERRFFWYGLAPLFYNGGIVLGRSSSPTATASTRRPSARWWARWPISGSAWWGSAGPRSGRGSGWACGRRAWPSSSG